MDPESLSLGAKAPNPFSLPSDTDLRFVLLIAALLAATSFMALWQYNSTDTAQTEQMAAIKACIPILQASMPFDLDRQPIEYVQEQGRRAQVFAQCQAQSDMRRGAWIARRLAGLLALALAIYCLLPRLLLWWRKWEPFTELDDPAVTLELSQLVRHSGLTTTPRFVIDAFDPSPSGALAFGTMRRKYIKLSSGVVARYHTDRSGFQTILLHELAHLRNADVDKTFFTIALLLAFGLTSVIPFAYALARFSSERLPAGWRAALLSMLVVITGIAVLRARELYADARAAEWRDSPAPLVRLLNLLAPPRSIGRLLHVHPTPARRSAALSDSSALFEMDPWESFVAGLVATAILRNIWMFVGAFMNSSGVPRLIPTVCALLSIPIGLGIVGVGVWRNVQHRHWSGRSTGQTSALAWTFGIGLIIGEALSFQEIVQHNDRLWWVNAGWGACVLAATHVCLRWVESCARMWMRNASDKPAVLRGACWGCVILAGLLFSHAFGIGLIARSALSQDPSSVDATLIIAGLGYEQMLSLVTSSALLVLWIYPFASTLFATGVEATSGNANNAINPSRTRLSDACAVAARASVAFFAVLLMLHVAIRLWVPAEVQDQGAFNMAFFWLRVTLSAIAQTVCAVHVARTTRHSPVLHGLATAFIASILMSAAWIAARWLFSWGNSFDVQFTFVNVANFGALAALPAAALASRRHPPSAAGLGISAIPLPAKEAAQA